MINYLDEYINPQDVDLTGFKLKDRLNNKIWINNKLNSDVRKELLSIANDFIIDSEMNYNNVIDVIFTGSLANYNWNEKYSDIDLHIVVNFSEISADPLIAKKYYDEKRWSWNKSHENISILGFPVEIYVQDVNEPHHSTGVYSILFDKWLVTPQLKNLPDTSNSDHVKKAVSVYCNSIDALLATFEDFKNDSAAIEHVLNLANSLMDAIKAERQEAMSKYKLAELTTGNLIFKSLRRNGYIEKLIKLKQDCYDIIHSINL